MQPTHVTEFFSTLLDHIYSNKRDLHATAGIVICDVSGHLGIFALIKHASTVKKSETKSPTRSFAQTNIDYFNNILENTDFNEVFNETCPNKEI